MTAYDSPIISPMDKIDIEYPEFCFRPNHACIFDCSVSNMEFTDTEVWSKEYEILSYFPLNEPLSRVISGRKFSVK